MPTRDIIVIGASAGGVQAVIDLARHLPADLPAALFVVIHTSPDRRSFLPELISSAGPLPAVFAEHGEPVRCGRIYVARPDHHLLLMDHKVHLSRGPRENGFRPAADPLFRTAAKAYGPRVIGVVLSGGQDDGTIGMHLIKQAGGIAIVQDPADATHPSMPASAMAEADVDHVLPLAEMPALLVQLTAGQLGKGASATNRLKRQKSDISEVADLAVDNDALSGQPSGFICPECGGALWEREEGKTLLYRCHVGHSFTGEGLLTEQGDALESALWTALRTLEENAALNRRLAERMKQRLANVIARNFEQRALDSEQRAAAIRAVLLSEKPPLSEKARALVRKQPASSLTRMVRGQKRTRKKR